jgi:biopolymer transport protein ExbD
MARLAIRRAPPSRTGISIVSMIDVMIILLFFFMVTSTYLNLDMVPAVEHSDDPAPVETMAAADAGTTVLVRIRADGSAAIGGQVLSPDALAAMIRDRLADAPMTPVVILPSGGANMQALITVMDTLTTAGAVRLRVIRLEAAP